MGIIRHGPTLYHKCHLDLFDDLFQCYGFQTWLHITLFITVGDYKFEQPAIQMDNRAVQFWTVHLRIIDAQKNFGLQEEFVRVQCYLNWKSIFLNE